jgi:hypothetical protein
LLCPFFYCTFIPKLSRLLVKTIESHQTQLIIIIMAIGTKGCQPYSPYQRSAYGYEPSLAAGIILCILFGLSMLAHTFQAIRTRALWNLLFAIGALSTFATITPFISVLEIVAVIYNSRYAFSYIPVLETC